MIKIVSIAIVFAIIILYLKSINNELAFLATIGAGIILLFSLINYISQTFDFLTSLVELSGLDNNFYKIIFKITAIGYLIEFGASTLQDFGLKSLSEKLIFAGKIIILSVSLPIIYAIYNLMTGLIS